MAAGGTSTNVQTGPGRLYMAPIGTTEPVSASAALPSAWIAIGYTEQGHEYVSDITSEPIEVAEELDPIRYENTRRISRVTFSMAEATKRRLALALGSGSAEADDATAYEPPDPGSEVGVMLVWDSDEDPTTNANVRWIYRQAKPSGTVTVAHGKAPAKALIPVTFNLEKPTGLKPVKVFPNASGHIA
jgi:hypothetical protein